MTSLSLYTWFETKTTSDSKVINVTYKSKRAKAHGKNNINVRPPWSAIFFVIVYREWCQSIYSGKNDLLTDGTLSW